MVFYFYKEVQSLNLTNILPKLLEMLLVKFVPDQVLAFFSMVMTSKVGNRENALFWTNKRIHDKSIVCLAAYKR